MVILVIMNSKEEFKERIQQLLAGIDKDKVESEDGWWETSDGAKLGSEILSKITDIIDEYEIYLDVSCDMCYNRTSVDKMPCCDCHDYSWFSRYPTKKK